MYLWIVATLVAFYIKGLCGFANTLVFTSILSFGADNVNISPIELVLGYPTNLILTWKNKSKLKAAIVLPLSLLVLLGSIPGAFLLKNIDATYIKIVFGIVVVLLGIDMLLREIKDIRLKGSKLLLGLIGVLSGLLCGIFGVGALLAAYVGRVTETGDEFKANISAVFIVENSFRIVFYSVLGIITLTEVKRALWMMPFMLIGLFLGIKSADVLDDKVIKKIVIVLLIISGVVLVASNI
ncbi:MAG: sulfite exporter TauE/SafE family protein [Lachnospiraceae bacterium]|nr:sulfite exporter TauE/SafE family protein [Lachnospiraceae bacterium]